MEFGREGNQPPFSPPRTTTPRRARAQLVREPRGAFPLTIPAGTATGCAMVWVTTPSLLSMVFVSSARRGGGGGGGLPW